MRCIASGDPPHFGTRLVPHHESIWTAIVDWRAFYGPVFRRKWSGQTSRRAAEADCIGLGLAHRGLGMGPASPRRREPESGRKQPAVRKAMAIQRHRSGRVRGPEGKGTPHYYSPKWRTASGRLLDANAPECTRAMSRDVAARGFTMHRGDGRAGERRTRRAPCRPLNRTKSTCLCVRDCVRGPPKHLLLASRTFT